jgi:hypothetical protein
MLIIITAHDTSVSYKLQDAKIAKKNQNEELLG